MSATYRSAGTHAVAIRPAGVEDVPPVAAIEAASFTQPWSRRSFVALVRATNVCFLVATNDAREVQGYAIAYCAADQSELANLAVRAGARGTGIGRALLEAVMSASVERGARTMYLEVRESNVAAQHLYRSAGFRPVARRKRYYEEPAEDALVLRCDFAAAAATDAEP